MTAMPTRTFRCLAVNSALTIQWNLSYPGSVGPRGARNFKIARNYELIHELCTWLYKTLVTST